MVLDVNAGCRITTLVYTQVHHRTVTDDYYAAMEKVEQRLVEQVPRPTGQVAENGNRCEGLLGLVDTLDAETEGEKQQALVEEIRQGLLALAV